MICGRCGGETPEGKRFCKDCGAPLGASCPACGAEVIRGSRFCADCGTPLEMPAKALEGVAGAPPAEAAPPAELRHVSVLFCDLVGFTPLSETRDPAEMREFLSGYFEVARAVIGRYGGVIEKFIGDAVMAVWGAPVAKEDDAERAVRAGLDLLAGVADYGEAAGVDLLGRVGIVTGRVATSTSETEGLVVGDRVNTAARIQSAAPPGRCYVDETTRAATSAAIAYRDAGRHELKGKAEPAHLFEALRVEAAIAGSQRANIIEAPFTGREHELRLLKELLHASIDRRSARLALVSGVAGIGKSRLAWELFKYVDGIAQELLWHSGRCPSYGDGVSYWALSEMVRARLQISEEDPPAVAAERLRAGLERWIPSPADREFIAPRLAQLLGLGSDQSLMRQELFAGWRLFFERLAEHLPVVMVVEDLQWADPGLVEFLDQLLDWSADHAVFLLVLARPEGVDRAGPMLARRNVTTISLDPLPDAVVGRLLDGLVADLPAEARQRIVERAEGIPLYALETVRALIDRGVISRGADALRVTGEIGTLDVPPELTALISSRLDTLGAKERQLVKECAVLGDTFPRHAVEAVTDLLPSEIDELLATLVRREVLTVRADKLSPERGQYAFTQSLIRSVAYETLSGAERKARHLRTARHLREAFGGDGGEAAEVVAAHLRDAYLAAAGDGEADEIRSEAEHAAVAAGERAVSVGAVERAEAAFLRAAELAAGDRERAGYLVQAARMANEIDHERAAIEHAAAAKAIFEVLGDRLGAASAALAHGIGAWRGLRPTEAIEVLEPAVDSLAGLEVPRDLEADLHVHLGAAYDAIGLFEQARAHIDAGLVIAQQHNLSAQLVSCLDRRAQIHQSEGRLVESRLFYEAAAAAAKEGDRLEARSENNLGWFYAGQDLPAAEDHLRKALAIARRRGARRAEAATVDSLVSVLMQRGRLAEARALLDEVGPDGDEGGFLAARRAVLDALSGDPDSAVSTLSGVAGLRSSEHAGQRSVYLWAAVLVHFAAGDMGKVLEFVGEFLEAASAENRHSAEGVRDVVPLALDAALALGRPAEAEALLADMESRPRGLLAPSVLLQVKRGRALLRAAEGDDHGLVATLSEVERGFAELGYEFWRARVAQDLAAHLEEMGRRAQDRPRAGGAAGPDGELAPLPRPS